MKIDPQLLTLSFEIIHAVLEAQKTAQASGTDLETLMANARAENATDVYEKLGVPRPAPEPADESGP